VEIFDSIVEFVFWIGDGLWHDDFVGDWNVVDGSVCVVDGCVVDGQWGVDGTRVCRGNEEGSDDEELEEIDNEIDTLNHFFSTSLDIYIDLSRKRWSIVVRSRDGRRRGNEKI
jgi:hypothetical protein